MYFILFEYICLHLQYHCHVIAKKSKEKKQFHKELTQKKITLNKKLQNLNHKIKLINNSDLDYLDMLYREKLRYGTKNEIIIKLK